jgi:Ca2+/Na+ antiporter
MLPLVKYFKKNLGHGDMAVSNAIGSNVFDILICLGLPWFIETTMVTPGRDVVVHSKGS